MIADFSPEQLAVLRQHGIVLFAQRVIFEAQPPMPADQIADVQRQCAGPIPAALLALWQETAGGSLDYDLTLAMGSHQEAISWTELFFNGSSAYRDLQGWIEAEQALADEAAEESGRPPGEPLRYLPIGGFDYLNRIYVDVAPGPNHGQVIAWKQGLPPAWRHCLHRDSVQSIGGDLLAGFAALQLDRDPLEPSQDFCTGHSLLDYLGERVEEHGMPQELADALIAFYRRALVDWRGLLSAGTLASQPALARLALSEAIAADDAALVARLAEAGIGFSAPLNGHALPTEVAVGTQSYLAAMALLQAGAPVTPDILSDIASAVPSPLVALLLERGARPTTEAIAQCAACGATDSARLIARALAGAHPDLQGAYAESRNALAADLQDSLKKVKSGKMSHYLRADGLTQRLASLKSFELP